MVRRLSIMAVLSFAVTAAVLAVAQPASREVVDAPSRPIQSGDTITIPVGETVLQAPIAVTHGQAVRIVGSGSGQSILTYAGPPGGCAIDLVSCYGCEVRDVDIRADSPDSTGVRYRTVADTSGKLHPTRNVLENVRLYAGSHRWKRCVDVDSLIPPGRDNNQDFYRFTRVGFFGYAESGLRINGSQAKAWTLDQCEFYGNGSARVGLDLEMSGSGVLTNNYFSGHTFASIRGSSLWAGDSILVNGGTTEATHGESLLSVGNGGYPFPVTITGYCYRGRMPANRGVVEFGKAGHLSIVGSTIWIADGYAGQPIVRCHEIPGTGAGSVSVRGCEFATHYPQSVPKKGILSAPKSWAVDWAGTTARSLNPPGPWNNDPSRNPHRSHPITADDARTR